MALCRIAARAVVAGAITAASQAQPLAPVPSEAARYDGHRIVRIDVGSWATVRRLAAAGIEPYSCQVRPGPTDFLVPPDALGVLRAVAPVHVVVVGDVQSVLDAETARLRDGAAGGGDWFADFKPPAQVRAFVDDLVARRPDLCSTFEIGRSLQDRPIYALRITNDAAGDGRCKPALLLNSLIHAREWITVMVNLFVADTLVGGYDTDPHIRDLVDRVEFIFVPVLNPDGYEHTWTVNRMHRKNMRPTLPSDIRRGHDGVDLNRNFGFMWGGHGSSSWPGSQTYRGESPFSEPESAALRDFTLASPQIRSHNDMHSYSRLIMYPWGHTAEPPPMHDIFDGIAAEMQRRILDASGRFYDRGPVYTTIYPVSGGTTDWFFGEAGILSFSYELGDAPFDPDPATIRLVAEETLPATLHQAEYIADHFPFRADFDRSCTHEFPDVLAFLAAFDAREPEGDFNGDGAFDVLDVLGFLDAFSRGA